MSLSISPPSLRRRAAADAPSGIDDLLRQAVPPAEAPPIADGRHQSTSRVTARAATVGLLSCLLLAPVGAGAGVLALVHTSAPAPVPPAAVTDQASANQRAMAGEFAERVVLTWLSTTVGRVQDLGDLVGDASNGAVLISRQAFTAQDPAVAGITQTDQDTWSVTIAATVTDTRPSSTQPKTRRYYQLPVQVTPAGAVTALTLPAPISAPPIIPTTTSDEYAVPLSMTSPVGHTVTEFLGAYLTGTGDVSRYLTPGVALSAVTPAPYTSVELDDLRAGDPSAASPDDGDRMRVLATATASVTDTQSSVVVYALTLTARAGRWEITGIDTAPLHDAPSATPTPEASNP
jgi:hypothetical protein